MSILCVRMCFIEDVFDLLYAAKLLLLLTIIYNLFIRAKDTLNRRRNQAISRDINHVALAKGQRKLTNIYDPYKTNFIGYMCPSM